MLVAITLGLGATATVYSLLKKNAHAPVVVVHTEKMVEARKAIAPGAPISADDLTSVTVDGPKKTQGTFATPEEVAGRVAMMPINEGQPILSTMLADPNAGAGLQALLPDGTRAITLQVDEVSGVGGLLMPGCSVDLLTSLHEGGADSLLTKTLVQDVKVIAVGQTLGIPSADGGIARSVTLIVTPTQAEKIELASNVGRPRLILRSGTDHKVIESSGVRLSELDNTKLPAIAQNVGPAARSVVVIRGGTESIVTFPSELSANKSASNVAGGKLETNPVAPR